LQKDKETSIV
jgi:hypothetical protein